MAYTRAIEKKTLNEALEKEKPLPLVRSLQPSSNCTLSYATYFSSGPGFFPSSVPSLQVLAGIQLLKGLSSKQQYDSFSYGEKLRLRPALEHLTSILCSHVIKGKKDEAKIFLKENKHILSELLTLKAAVVDYSGRQIRQTAYQMAIAAGDVFVKFEYDVCQPEAKGEEMKEMLERYFRQLPDAEPLMKEQIQELFPEGFEAYLEKKNAEDLAAVTKIFQAIINAEADDEENLIEECKIALQEFKNYLEPKGVIETGMHFNPLSLVEAYRLYDNNFKSFANGWNDSAWTSPKNLYAWQKVIGLIQRYLTACDAMVLCQGPYYLVQDCEKFKRILNFRNGGGVYFPLDSDPSWSFGKNAAARVPGGAPGWWCGWARRAPPGECVAACGNIMSSKNIVVAKAYARSRQSVEDAVRNNVGRRRNNA